MPLEITKETSRGIDASIWVVGSQSYSRESGELCFELWGYPSQAHADAMKVPLETLIIKRSAPKSIVAMLESEVLEHNEWSGAKVASEVKEEM